MFSVYFRDNIFFAKNIKKVCLQDSEVGGYTVTIVVQHDKDLVTPGDLGFTLLCKDERSVNASLEG